MAGFQIVLVSIISLVAVTPLLSGGAELATEVCKQTKDFDFCHAWIYSEPNAATADRYELVDIVIRKAYSNASDTKDYIASHMKSAVGNESESLKKCVGDYNKAIQSLSQLLNDLNSETYDTIDDLSLDVEGSVRDCEQVSQNSSIIYERNEEMLKLANICYVVSKLFE
ncbi:hypothetical protein ACS0TY_032200 [Phlomoides rotata]